MKVAGFAAAAILAFLVVLLAPRVAHAAEFTVTNTNNSGTGSLRTVISAANSNDNSPTMDTITFAIPDNPSIPGLEVKTISPTSALPPITEPVAIDGYTQPGASENTAITNANNAVLKIQLSGNSAPANAFGLAVGPDAAGTMVKGLVINRFGEEGVFINADNTVIAGNIIGTNAAGTSDLGNGADGVSIRSSGNVVGGPANAAQNVISGNGENGVSVRLAGATNNTISNNHIGTDENAEEDLGNSISGVFIEDAPGVIVGGDAPGGAGQDAGGEQGEGNIISGNNEHGVEIIGAGASGSKVLGNYIGVNRNSNGFSNIGNTLDGVLVSTATQVEIGGTTGTTPDGPCAGLCNVISDNGRHGVEIANSTSASNKVLGNRIGTDRNGGSDFGNVQDGVLVQSSGNVIGGTTSAARNVISGNDRYGVHLSGSGSTDNEVLGNFIGTDENGTADLGNAFDGVHFEGNVSQNEVAGNTLSGNGSGVEIFGPGATGNEVQGNFIGTNASIASGLGNSGFGVFINASDNFVGGTASGDGNTIAFNGQEGVVIAGNASTGNRILRNSIFSNGGLGINLIGGKQNTAGATANDAKDPDTGPNTLQNKPVLTSLNGLTIEGELNSTPNRTFTIQFFANTSGNEGASFLGQESVTTNSNGNVNFTFTATVGPIGTQNATATATRAGNTSEFSAPRTATP